MTTLKWTGRNELENPGRVPAICVPHQRGVYLDCPADNPPDAEIGDSFVAGDHDLSCVYAVDTAAEARRLMVMVDEHGCQARHQAAGVAALAEEIALQEEWAVEIDPDA